ncbi:glutathione S-transferase family protein [Marinobacter zhejiangensis]|uniref:Glutathione S-transferase n=1 Tax=Marinobacter zhejiangensis TaxID=488535 RepID=A0A1I4LN49_9GAMM|nr:glutathione S-transferase family protein [Marinobacter zhejiangensis]SFL92017.1 Glutathione S-transferase [Marinobacter zhejiangensis]
MPDLILYHYAMSPFSEKIRAMLGYAGLEWYSVTTREMPPRPQLERLTGGYRKIPVAQRGADVFCDTRTIATEIARLSGKPELALENCDPEIQAYVQNVDLEVFLCCLMTSGSWALSRKVLASMSLLDVGRLLWDRIKVGRQSSVKARGLRNPKARVREHLLATEERLRDQPFLFGESPCHADFATYHSLWFMREYAESPQLDGFDHLLAWMDRIRDFGHGGRQELTAEQALAFASEAEPEAVPHDWRRGRLIGREVSIAPSDYAQEPTYGVLVAEGPDQWILERNQDDLGRLHVHLPSHGYTLAPVWPEPGTESAG